MKLKKTLSMLIGGICLVAATTVALAGPMFKCPTCNGDMSVYNSRIVYNKVGSHKIGSMTCTIKGKFRRDTFRCSQCGNSFNKDTRIGSTEYHTYHNCPWY